MPEPITICAVLSAAFAALVLFAARNRYRHLIGQAEAREQRRIARELHDGLAQELAFISLNARHVALKWDDRMLDQIADAAERAVSESRELMSILRSKSNEKLGAEVTRVAEALAERHGATISLDVDPELRANAETGGQLLRIMAEALTNSLVHGRAETVSVQLSGGDGLRLRVADDGIGFEPGVKRPGEHFGLVGMRERAREIGAEFLLRSRPGAGTEVEVVVT